MVHRTTVSTFFFFNDTATTEIYTLSLHDALPISQKGKRKFLFPSQPPTAGPITNPSPNAAAGAARSEEHTSELQSQSNLVCRLLLEKKKKTATRRREHLHTGTTGSRARCRDNTVS